MKMKCFGLVIAITALVSVGFANGASYVNARNSHVKTTSVKIAAKTHHKESSTMRSKGYGNVVATVRPGSLKYNIQRILKQHGWKQVVWEPSYDFTFVGSVRIRANSIQGVMKRLLQDYPLQAIFYQGNRVVEIHSRAL